MKRGEFYRVHKGSKHDPKDHRIFLIVSRQDFIESSFSSVVCAPVYSKYHGIDTQIEVGMDEGLKHDSAIYCDALISIPKTMLTDYVGTLSGYKLKDVNSALRIALAIG
jgi:mRNA interferase MazF